MNTKPLDPAADLPIPFAPYYQDAHCTIYNADCRKVLPWLEPVDLLLTDPPYGMNLNTDNRRFSGGNKGNRAKGGNNIGTGRGRGILNDEKPFDPRFMLDSRRRTRLSGAGTILPARCSPAHALFGSNATTRPSDPF
jgi:hypothetical protein